MILCSQEPQQEHRRQTEATLGDTVLKFLKWPTFVCVYYYVTMFQDFFISSKKHIPYKGEREKKVSDHDTLGKS